MKKFIMPLIGAAALLGIASTSHAQITPDAVEYVKICSLYGAAFHYIPGTDICVNEPSGQTREQTEGGTWTSVMPTNNQGHWVTNPQADCPGRLVKLPTAKATDFKLNTYNKYQVAPFPFRLNPGEFISKVMMSGGFVDPFQPQAANPALSMQQFCLRTADPNFILSDLGGQPFHVPFCNPTPLGCVSNSELVGTPAAYSFPALGAPVVHYNTDASGRLSFPATCGTQLVVTTGMGKYDPTTVTDISHQGQLFTPAGTLSTWVCVEQGPVVDNH